MNLEEELQGVEAELATALLEEAGLRARIEGLTAQRDSLLTALRRPHRAVTMSESAADLARLTKAGAIVEVLRRSPEPLRINDIVRALSVHGRPDENYNGISVSLNTLLSQHRVVRIDRGLYTVAS